MSKTKKAPAKKAAKSKTVNPADTFASIKNSIADMETDWPKFDAGQKAAGRRLRKQAMLIRRACGDLRKEIQAVVATL